jgi:hypothetical protein
MNKTSDPRSGETNMHLENLVLGEPDPALFIPPSDYTVTDETGPFQIQYRR